MNQAVFVGRLTREPTLKTFGEDQKVVNNTLAIERPYRNRKGEKMTDFIPFVAWGRMGEIIQKHTKKGDLISLSGQMQSRTYQKDDGAKVYVVECLVSQITLLNNNRRPTNEYDQTRPQTDNVDQVAESLEVPMNERVDEPVHS